MSSSLTAEEKAELEEIKKRLFDLANEKAGNDSGNASIFLHEAVNNVVKALDCFRRGNPKEEIPMRFIARAMGMGEWA